MDISFTSFRNKGKRMGKHKFCESVDYLFFYGDPVVLKSADAAGANVGLSTIVFSHKWIVQTPEYVLEADFTSFFFTVISRM